MPAQMTDRLAAVLRFIAPLEHARHDQVIRRSPRTRRGCR